MNSVAIINALISLCHPPPTAPDTLYQLGYRAKDVYLEYPTGATGGKGVVVDLLLLSAPINSILCIECKSGRNIEVAQGRGYQKVKAAQFAPLVSKWHTLDAFSVDVAYACNAAQLERISAGLKRENLEHSIICFHSAENGQLPAALEQYPQLRPTLEAMTQPCLITLERNKLKNLRLAIHLSRGVALDLANVPSFIRFDVSSDLAHIAHCLRQAVAELSPTGRTTFSSEELASAAYGTEAWLKTKRRAELLSRFNQALNAIADDASFGSFIAHESDPARHPAKLKWRINFNP